MTKNIGTVIPCPHCHYATRKLSGMRMNNKPYLGMSNRICTNNNCLAVGRYSTEYVEEVIPPKESQIFHDSLEEVREEDSQGSLI